MPSCPLRNFEIQKYYQKNPKFNVVYSRNNLAKIKDGAFAINLDEYESIGTHWIALYAHHHHHNNNNNNNNNKIIIIIIIIKPI